MGLAPSSTRPHHDRGGGRLPANTVLVGGVGGAFDDEGRPTSVATDAALNVLKDDVAWWADVLTAARGSGQLAPGNARFMQELTALSAAA